MLSSTEDVEGLFEEVGEGLKRPVKAVVIGGAALMRYGLKDSTKDIDIVCMNEEDREALFEAAQAVGCEIKCPEKRHKRFGLRRVVVKGKHTLDVFAGRISSDFELSSSMVQRATQTNTFGNLTVGYASKEDILIMKLIAGREGDVEDCANLVAADVDSDVYIGEIRRQYERCLSEKELSELEGVPKIWITYIEEGVGRLEERFNLSFEGADAISELSDDWKGKEIY